MNKDSDDRQIKGLLDIILNSELSNAEIRPRGNCKFSVFRNLGYLALRSRSSLQKFYGGHHAWPLWNFHISNDNVSFRFCIIFVSFVLFVFLHIVVSDTSWLFEKHGGCLNNKWGYGQLIWVVGHRTKKLLWMVSIMARKNYFVMRLWCFLNPVACKGQAVPAWNKTQHRKLKRWATRTPPKTRYKRWASSSSLTFLITWCN